VEKAKKNPLFEKTPRNFRIGGDVMPKRDLTRFTKWPKRVRLQRQKRIMVQRLKVPPTLAQFQATLDKNQFEQLARLLKKCTPETRAQKKQRLGAVAEKKTKGILEMNVVETLFDIVEEVARKIEEAMPGDQGGSVEAGKVNLAAFAKGCFSQDGLGGFVSIFEVAGIM